MWTESKGRAAGVNCGYDTEQTEGAEVRCQQMAARLFKKV